MTNSIEDMQQMFSSFIMIIIKHLAISIWNNNSKQTW